MIIKKTTGNQAGRLHSSSQTLNSNGLPRKINILFIIDLLWDVGGTENHLYYLVKYLNKERFNCQIVTFDLREDFVKKIRDENIIVHHIPVRRLYTLNAFLMAFKLRENIKKSKIDIVQTFHFKSDTYGALISKLSGVKHIISSRRDIGNTKKKVHFHINKICNRFIDQFITVCEKVGDRITEDENVPKSKQKTIYNGVDLKKFRPPTEKEIESYKKELGISVNDFVVGTVAQFRPEKNYNIFLKAIKKVKGTVRNLKVIAIGSGETMEASRKYCMDNGLNDIVFFAGQINDIGKYISVMDVSCLVPGSNEGFSNSILEKMAMSKPLVVTDIGGNAEAVVDGENGIVIPPLDSQKLADAIVHLYKNPSIREKMGRKSRERVEKLFTLEQMIRAYEEFYEQVMGKESV